MSTLVAVCFLIILGLLLASISVGLRFYEKQRRRRLVSMLRTVTQNGEERHVNLLIDEDQKNNAADEFKGALQFTKAMRSKLDQSGLGWTFTHFLSMSGVCFVVGAIGSIWIPLGAASALRALGAGACTATLPYVYVSKKRAARIAALEAQLPDALDFLARSMRAGHAFTISLEMVGQEIHEPLGQEFRGLFNEQNLGASLERSFDTFSRKVPIPDVRFFCSAVILQRQTGGNLSEILNRLSHIIRERFRLKGQVKAVSAHGRLTSTILTLLPIATMAGLMLTSPGYLTPMFDDPLGKKIIGAGVVAQIMGNFFIRKIIKIKV